MINENSVSGIAVVVGAGTMGGGIAALLANAGWRVRLLDVTEEVARAGRERVYTSKPPLLYLPEFTGRIVVGSAAEWWPRLRDADWVVEAVAERMELKWAVIGDIEAHTGPETIVSSNTSGLSLREMTEGRDPDFKQRFLGTHFLNPPRYLKLLELIPLPDTDPERAAGFARFAERVLGRRVVFAQDTPGFISTRIGIWHLLDCIHAAIRHGLTVEEADYLTGPLIGRPRSATFRLADLVGFDILADIAANQYERLPDDPFRDRLILPGVVTRLMAEGRRGEKSGAGFYKRENGETRVLDLETLDYRPRREVRLEAVEALRGLPLPERLRAIGEYRDVAWGRFLNAVLDDLSAYVRRIGPDIARDVLAIDRVLTWGFHWEVGPFEMADLRGDPPPGHLHYSGTGGERRYRVFGSEALRPLPAEPEYISLDELKAGGKTVAEIPEASLVDLGDGVACLEFHTKMNTFSPALSAFIHEARERAEREFSALVIGNQGPHFSAGYDLSLFLVAMAAGDWGALDTLLRDVQYAFLGLKYARVPVVGAPHGYTLGAGCECALHCHALQAAPELYMGLPELAVGVLPAGGGTKELLARAMRDGDTAADVFPHVQRVFDLIVSARRSSSAHEAQKMGFLRPTDGISANADRHLFEAAQRAISLANAGYRPPVKKGVWVTGADGLARLRLLIHERRRSGVWGEHDCRIADKVASVLSGGGLPYAQEVSEEYLLRLEREAFIALAREPEATERMRGVLTPHPRPLSRSGERGA